MVQIPKSISRLISQDISSNNNVNPTLVKYPKLYEIHMFFKNIFSVFQKEKTTIQTIAEKEIAKSTIITEVSQNLLINLPKSMEDLNKSSKNGNKLLYQNENYSIYCKLNTIQEGVLFPQTRKSFEIYVLGQDGYKKTYASLSNDSELMRYKNLINQYTHQSIFPQRNNGVPRHNKPLINDPLLKFTHPKGFQILGEGTYKKVYVNYSTNRVIKVYLRPKYLCLVHKYVDTWNEIYNELDHPELATAKVLNINGINTIELPYIKGDSISHEDLKNFREKMNMYGRMMLDDNIKGNILKTESGDLFPVDLDEIVTANAQLDNNSKRILEKYAGQDVRADETHINLLTHKRNIYLLGMVQK